jgi:hypothetical protein
MSLIREHPLTTDHSVKEAGAITSARFLPHRSVFAVRQVRLGDNRQARPLSHPYAEKRQVIMGDIGRLLREIEFEPLPEEEPVREPAAPEPESEPVEVPG